MFITQIQIWFKTTSSQTNKPTNKQKTRMPCIATQVHPTSKVIVCRYNGSTTFSLNPSSGFPFPLKHFQIISVAHKTLPDLNLAFFLSCLLPPPSLVCSHNDFPFIPWVYQVPDPLPLYFSLLKYSIPRALHVTA